MEGCAILVFGRNLSHTCMCDLGEGGIISGVLCFREFLVHASKILPSPERPRYAAAFVILNIAYYTSR